MQEAGVSLDAEQETLTMKFPAALAPGSATLRLQFTGVLNDKMRGFYRTKYAVAGEERWAAVTQFQPTDSLSSNAMTYQGKKLAQTAVARCGCPPAHRASSWRGR